MGLFDDVLEPAPKKNGGLFNDVLAAPLGAAVDSGPSPEAMDEVSDLIGIPRRKRSTGSLGETLLRNAPRLGQLGSQLLRIPATLARSAAGSAGVDVGSLPGASSVLSVLEAPSRAMDDFVGDLDQAGIGVNPVNIGQVKDALNPSKEAALGERARTLGTFISHGMAGNVSEIVAAGLAPAAYVGAYAEESTRERAANDGRAGAPTLGDAAIGTGNAAVQVYLEKLGLGRMLPGGTGRLLTGAPAAIGRVARETAMQGAIEAGQEAIDYAATTAGTETGATLGGAADAALAGLLIGSPLGAGSQGAQEAIGGRVAPAGPAAEPALADIVGGIPATPADIQNDAAIVEAFRAKQPDAVPAEPVDDIDALLARNLPPAEAAALSDVIAPEVLAEVMAALDLPPAAPASTTPSSEGAGVAATTEIARLADALGLQAETADGRDNPLAGGDMRRGPETGSDRRAITLGDLAGEAAASSDQAGLGRAAVQGDVAGTQAQGLTPARAPLNVRMNGQEIPVESFEDASRKFLQLKREADIGGMPVVELIDQSGNVVGNMGQSGEVFAGDYRNRDSREPAVYTPPGKETAKKPIIEGEAERVGTTALPAPSPAIPVAPDGYPAPPPARFSAADMRSLVGWSQEGGRMVRAPVDPEMLNEEQRAGLVPSPPGEVIGRTRWTGYPGPDGQESTFWKNRPVPYTPAQATAVFDKFEAGTKLTKREQRFIDYAQETAAGYDDALNLQADEVRGYEQIAAQQDMAELRAQLESDIADSDAAEAMSLADLYRELAQSGVDLGTVTPSDTEADGEYAARLWQRLNETRNGTDQPAKAGDSAQGAGGRGGREAGAGVEQAFERATPADSTPAEEVTPRETSDNWLGADQSFERKIDVEFGPAGADQRALESARAASAGTTTLETTTRPSGKQWHVLYISDGEGGIQSVSIGPRAEGSLPEIVAKAKVDKAGRDAIQADHRARVDEEITRQREIAAKNGYKIGAPLGNIIPTSGKLLRAARIVTDHGNGLFDVQGVAGNRQAIIRDMQASGIELAVNRGAASAGGESSQDVPTEDGSLFAGPAPDQADIEEAPAPRVTGTKNAVTDAEREAAGRDPILRAAVQSNEETVVRAMRDIQQDPLAGDEVVARLSRDGVEAISVADEALLLVHKTDLLNKREAAAKKLADPNASDSTKDAAREAWSEAEAKIAQLDIAASNAGREWGRFGQFRQRMMREDFTLAALERKERARLERPLTAEESATVKAMAAQIAELQEKVDRLQERMNNAASESAYEALARSIARPPRKRPTLESLRTAANDARARLAATQGVPSRRGQSGAILSPAVFYDYAVIGAFHIADGAAKFSDWVSAMSADLGDAFDRIKADHPNIFKAAQQEVEKEGPADPDAPTVATVLETLDPDDLTSRDVKRLVEAHIRAGVRGEAAVMGAVHRSLSDTFDGITEREVRRLFADYGNASFPSQEEVKVELRQLRSLVQMQESIDRISEGLAPLRSGPQRDAMTQQMREKRVRLNDLLKTLAKDAKSPTQMRSYNDMRVRNLTNQIEDLEKQIRTGDRPEAKIKASPTAEIQALVDRRDALVRERDSVDVGAKKNEAEKRALRKRIEAVEAKLRGEAPALKDPLQRVDDREATDLRNRLETLRDRRDQVGREAAAREGLGEQIAELMQRLAGKEKPAIPAKAPSSAVVAELRRIRDELATELRELERAPVDTEARYQAMRGKQIEKRIAELQARITAGDFAARPRVPRALSEANQRAMFELDKAKEAFLRHQFEDNLRKRTPLGKAFGLVSDTFNLARAMMTSFDLSAILRQGGFISYGHPLRAISSIGPSLKAFVSEANEHALNTEITSRKNAPLYKKYGLQLTGIGAGPLTQIEEAYASRWLSKLPWWTGGGLVRGSGRSYTAFLNKLRADSFDAMLATLALRAVPTEAEGKAIASYINVATGRGKVGVKEQSAQALNTVFFAPRLVASRFQLLAGQPLYGGTARTRKLIVQEYARFAVGVSVVLALTAFAMGEDDDDSDKPMIGLDPRSADFLKVRTGSTYIDPMAGLAQVSTFIARMATGETLTGKGEAKPLRTGYTLTDLRRALGSDIPPHEMAKDGRLPFGSGNAAGVLGRFLRTKLAPVPGAIVNVLSGSNAIGDPVTPAKAATEMVTPMSFQNIADVMEEHGVPKGAAITTLGLLGMGVQHRLQSNAQAFADFTDGLDSVRTDVKERLKAVPVERWPATMEALRKEYGPAMEGLELQVYKSDGKYGEEGEPRRDADGNPILKSNRIADNYREDSGAMEYEQVHHAIPDNLARHHPLMARARSLGYNLDNAGNLLNMPKRSDGDRIAHRTSHPDYDAEVFALLQDAEKRLKKEHGSLKDAPKPAVLGEVRKIEAEMRERIQKKDVPTKDGRLAVNDDEARSAA